MFKPIICFVFPAKPLLVTNVTESSSSLAVCIEVQQVCRTENYTIETLFGKQEMDVSDCDFNDNLNMTASNVVPGEPRCFEVNDSILQLSSGEVYCYNSSLIGDVGLLDGELYIRIMVHIICSFVDHNISCPSGDWWWWWWWPYCWCYCWHSSFSWVTLSNW